jgi:two-component system sensor histidine kinase/response regulator
MGPTALTERVLVVDDDPATRRLLVTILESEGYGAEQAEDAEGALSVVSRDRVDLVVLDVMLSGDLSGIDICQRLKAGSAELPVLFLTSLNDASTYRRAVEAGADDFLTKPVHRSELLLRIRSLLLLRRMQRDLARQNEVLTTQRDDLVRLTAQKHELMEIVIHDLKNPLAAIASNAGFLVQEGSLSNDARDCASAISRASDNMLRMLQNLLDVAREDDVGIAPHFEQVDMGAIVERTLGLMARRAADRNVALTADIKPTGVVQGDGDYMRRALENLLDNALRYTRPGGTVKVELFTLDDQVELRVTDSGTGIPEAHLDRIFDKYAQLDRAIDRAQSRFGRGLGLTFCRLVAEAHGGTISAENVTPHGARFRLRFPPVRSE